MDPGSAEFPYKLVIIGGGPSGCSIIVRAVRTGFFEQLCLADAKEMLAGVCLVDRCARDRFGGGKLQDYAINSNTWANKFVAHVTEDKPDTLPPESVRGTPLEALRHCGPCQAVEAFGAKHGSLQVIGGWLRELGAAVLSMVNAHQPTSRCLTRTALQRAQRYRRNMDGLVGWKLTLTDLDSGATFAVHAKDVAFATGGKQEPPTLPNPAHHAKVLASDFAVTDEGIEELRRRVRKNVRNGGKGKVVVVGGSHSAFSAAWVCLHKMPDNPSSSSSSSTAVAVAAGVSAPSCSSSSSGSCGGSGKKDYKDKDDSEGEGSAGRDASTASAEEKSFALPGAPAPPSPTGAGAGRERPAGGAGAALAPPSPTVFILHRSFIKVSPLQPPNSPCLPPTSPQSSQVSAHNRLN